MNPNNLPQKIKEYLEYHKRPLTWLADQCGVSYGHLVKIYKGERIGSDEIRNKILKIFGFKLALVPLEGGE